jgi:hypothetical protein
MMKRRKLKSYERCPRKHEDTWRCTLPLNHDGWCRYKIVRGLEILGLDAQVRAALAVKPQ